MGTEQDNCLRLDVVAALLQTKGLSMADLKVLVALARIGQGRPLVVTLAEIAGLAGIQDTCHVARALRRLGRLGLYHHRGKGREIARWITWQPTQIAKDGTDERDTDNERERILDQLTEACQGVLEVDPAACMEALARAVPRLTPRSHDSDATIYNLQYPQ